MKRFLWPLLICLLATLGAVSGCSGNSTNGVRVSTLAVTVTPEVRASPTSAVLSVELGTGLAGTIPNVSIVNPTTRFTAGDTFAFVIHLRAPISATKVACLIYDPDENIAWQWDLSTDSGATVLASSTPRLGTVLERYTGNGLAGAPAITPPVGTYVLQVEPYPSSPINYADNATFLYAG